LVVADVILFNAKAGSAGNTEAFGYTLLETILSVHLKKFAKDLGKKKLVLVLRDFDPYDHQKVKGDLEEKLSLKMWPNIDKPEEFVGRPMKDFFDLEIVTFSNFKFQKSMFHEECMEFGKRFTAGSGNSIF